MENYENSEYEMLKRSTENNVQNSSAVKTNAATEPNDKANLKGLVSLVLGIVALALNHLWYVSLIAGIIAIVFGVQSNTKGNRNNVYKR